MAVSRWPRRQAEILFARRAAHVVLLSAAAALAVSCGSGPSAPSPSDPVMVIGPAGVAQVELRIKAWSRVTFVNNDTRPHTIVSDPVDVHTQCPPVNQVGLLNPGESRSTGDVEPHRHVRLPRSRQQDRRLAHGAHRCPVTVQ